MCPAECWRAAIGITAVLAYRGAWQACAVVHPEGMPTLGRGPRSHSRRSWLIADSIAGLVQPQPNVRTLRAHHAPTQQPNDPTLLRRERPSDSPSTGCSASLVEPLCRVRHLLAYREQGRPRSPAGWQRPERPLAFDFARTPRITHRWQNTRAAARFWQAACWQEL